VDVWEAADAKRTLVVVKWSKQLLAAKLLPNQLASLHQPLAVAKPSLPVVAKLHLRAVVVSEDVWAVVPSVAVARQPVADAIPVAIQVAMTAVPA
jgi:hypothetical protein